MGVEEQLALGWIILGGLLLHLFNFWSKMQLVEVLGHHENSLGFSPQDGAALIQYTFSQWYYVVIYLVWFFALWFHLTHGVWSMFQSVGWGNDIWYPRLKCIANIVATVVFLVSPWSCWSISSESLLRLCLLTSYVEL